MFLNYTVRNDTIFDQTKIGISFNSITNERDVTGVTPSAAPVPVTLANGSASPYLASAAQAPGDLLTETPGRSVMVSVTFGLSNRHAK